VAEQGISSTYDEMRIVTNLTSPPTWFHVASEFFPPKPRKLSWLAFSPSDLCCFQVRRVFDFKGIHLQSSKWNILSCTLAPPRRFHRKPAASLLHIYVNRRSVSKDTLLPSAFRPFSISGFKSPSFHFPYEKASLVCLP